MAEEPKKPRRRTSALAKAAEQLRNEIREAYAVVGVELSDEKLKERLERSLDEMAFVYCIAKLCDAVQLPHCYVGITDPDSEAMARNANQKDDEDD